MDATLAGVHYFTDAFESILLGEEIAIGILEEQKLTFGENFAFTTSEVRRHCDQDLETCRTLLQVTSFFEPVEVFPG